VRAEDGSQVDVVQVALVINIGFGVANTSGNAAVGVTPGSAGGGANALGSVSGTTGDALGVGTQATTRILQAAVVQTRTGDDANSVENALVINLGDGTANSGLNRIIGVLSQNGADYGLGGATGMASVTSGDASAIGASANTVIKQSVNADASDSGFIVITQRAVVFNLGAAIANTGFNSATGVGDMGLTDAQLAALVQLYQILNALLEAGGWALPPDGGPSGGVGQAVGGASLHTGDATAVGVNTGTSVTQKVDATAVGGSINASQDAVVANVGLGVANTGGNVAAGVATGSSGGGVNAAAVATLADFLAALSGGTVSPDGTADVAGLFDFGGLIAQLTGHADALDQVVGSAPTDLVGPADDPAAPQTKHTRIRQVIGVLTFAFSSANGQDTSEAQANVVHNDTETNDIGITVANGFNTSLPHHAEQTVVGGSSSASDSTGDPPDPDSFVADVTGVGTLQTGDVVAGNVDNTKVCQVHNADPVQCDPVIRWIVLPGRPTVLTAPLTPKTVTVTVRTVRTVTQVVIPGAQVRSVVVASDPGSGVRAETLPVTGAQTESNLSLAGVLLGAGVFLVLVAALVPRRRATG